MRITSAGSAPTSNASVSAGTLLQIIPADMIHAGGAYRLSWTDTATCRVYQGAASGAYAASPLSLSLTAGTTTTVECGTGTLGRVQLEAGTVVTPYEFRGDEQARCDRFLPYVSATLRFPAYGSAQALEVYVTHRVPMRVEPTATLVAAGGRANVSGVSMIQLNRFSSRFQIISSGGGDTYALGDRWLLSAEP